MEKMQYISRDEHFNAIDQGLSFSEGDCSKHRCFFCLSPSGIKGQNLDGKIVIPESFPVAYIHITQIEITGNARTKEKIITRELDFSLGDSLAL